MTDTPPRQPAGAGYWVRLVALVLLAVAATLWFRAHLEPLMTGTTLIGGTVTLWGVWKMAQGLFFRLADRKPEAIGRGLLQRPGAGELLAFVWIAFAFAAATTSSVYVEYRGDRSAPAELVVEVLEDGQLVLPPLTVRSYEPVAGRPFLLSPAVRQLELRVANLPEYGPLRRTLRPWTPLKVRVPVDFPEARLKLLRIVPWGRLRRELPNPADQPTVHYELRVAVAGRTYVLEDLRRRTVLTGLSATALERLAGREELTRSLEADLAERMADDRVPEDRRPDLLAEGMARPLLLPTADGRDGERVTIEVFREGEREPLARRELTLAVGVGIGAETVFLEVRG